MRGLRRGVGSVDYIHTLLIMEDDLDDTDETGDMIAETETVGATCTTMAVTVSSAVPDPSPGSPLVDWCICALCRPIKQTVENKCCKQATCIITTSRFAKLCLDPDVLEMCIRNTGDMWKMQVHVLLGKLHTEKQSMAVLVKKTGVFVFHV